MVYRTLGFGLDEGHFSRVSRRDNELSPSASVSTSETQSTLAGHRVVPRKLKTCLSSHIAAPRIWESHHCSTACVRAFGEHENDKVWCSGVRINGLLDQHRISWVHERLDSLRYRTDGSINDGKRQTICNYDDSSAQDDGDEPCISHLATRP